MTELHVHDFSISLDGSGAGRWGEDPPFHHDVFVLTHHPRPSLTMAGGTTSHFVPDGIEAALDRATVAARGGHVRLRRPAAGTGATNGAGL